MRAVDVLDLKAGWELAPKPHRGDLNAAVQEFVDVGTQR